MNRFARRAPSDGTQGESLPLRGREAELAALGARLGALAHGRGGVVCVDGAPGAGKTRLLAEAYISASRARRAGTACGRGPGRALRAARPPAGPPVVRRRPVARRNARPRVRVAPG
ncbi:ATP-binding protein [Streptomyces canus]|uniref:ATP-binding protein n=1 Tax=Streptomyces canus TaxID=58343 RepID=UPI00358E551F